jgi:hypothetical protein
MSDEINPDHIITDPKLEYKVNTFFTTVDDCYYCNLRKISFYKTTFT